MQTTTSTAGVNEFDATQSHARLRANTLAADGSPDHRIEIVNIQRWPVARKILEASILHLDPEAISFLKIEDCHATWEYFCFLADYKLLLQVPDSDWFERLYIIPSELRPLLQFAFDEGFSHIWFHLEAQEIAFPLFDPEAVRAAFEDKPFDESDIVTGAAEVASEQLATDRRYDGSPGSFKKIAIGLRRQIKVVKHPLDFGLRQTLKIIIRLGHASALEKLGSLESWTPCDGVFRDLMAEVERLIDAAGDSYIRSKRHEEGLLFAARFAMWKSLTATPGRFGNVGLRCVKVTYRAGCYEGP